MSGKAFVLLDRTIEALVVAVVVAMIAVGGLQVFSRYALNHSLSWTEEFQKFCHVWMIFLAIPVGYNRGSHIGMEVFRNRLPAPARRWLDPAVDLMWLALGSALVVHGARLMAVAGHQASPGLRLRMDLVYSCIVLGGAYLVLVACRKLAGRVRRAAQPEGGL